MDREELDYAIRYPFTSRARKVVEEVGFDLEKPPIAVLDRARQRVEGGVDGSFQLVKSTSESTLLTELLSYPVSKILVALTKSRSIAQRYSNAESDRLLRELLAYKDHALLEELAGELGLGLQGGKVSFNAYVKASSERFPLVNAPLKSGLVEVDDSVLAEVVAKTLRNRLVEELSKSVVVPGVYNDYAASLRKDLKKSYATEDLGALNIAAFPPCIKALIQDMRAGEKMPHQPRFVLSSFLVNVGMPIDSIVALFSSTPNFNAKKTRYYVEYSAGKRGSGVKYTPPSCKKMEFYGLCRDKDALCNRVGHPLSYYSRRKR